MSKRDSLKEELLKESDTEIELKKFLPKINMFLGEDIAVSALSTRKDIVESLNILTNKFENKKSREIAFILLKYAVLSSNTKNYYVQDIKNLIAYGEFKIMLDLVNTNPAYRKGLTRNLIYQNNKTAKSLYNELENKEHVIEDLDNLRFYEHIENENENEFRLVLKSR